MGFYFIFVALFSTIAFISIPPMAHWMHKYYSKGNVLSELEIMPILVPNFQSVSGDTSWTIFLCLIAHQRWDSG